MVPSRDGPLRRLADYYQRTGQLPGWHARGAELVGELERYQDRYRLCYVRGPEGIIVELAEQIG